MSILPEKVKSTLQTFPGDPVGLIKTTGEKMFMILCSVEESSIQRISV